MPSTLPNAERKRILEAIRFRFTNSTVGLWTAVPALNGSVTLESLTEASFPGYQRGPIQLIPEVQHDGAHGRHELHFSQCGFRPTAEAPTQTVLGWFLLDGVGQLALVYQLAQPVFFGTPADHYRVRPVIQLWSTPTT